MKTNEDVLNIIYRKKESVIFRTNGKKLVIIMELQNHKIQRFFRKVGFKIPKYKEIEMDKFSSFIFLLIDGEKTVREIGEIIEEKFGEEIKPLYERLLLFLNHIDVNCNYIEKINEI